MDIEQYEADMEAIRHEFETVWEAINVLQGIDPAKAGEPSAKKETIIEKVKKLFAK